MYRFLLCALLCLSAPIRTAPAQATTFTVDAAQSLLEYTGHHPAHSWKGTSHEAIGTILLDVAAPAQSRINLRVPVQSFDSGNAVRDAKMLRLVESARFPEVTFISKTVHIDAWAKTATGYQGTWRVRGHLIFHGQTHPVEIPTVVRLDGDVFEAECAWAVSLIQFQVQRPALFFVPIKEHIDLTGTIRAVSGLAAETRH